MGTYGEPERWAGLYRRVTAHRELRDQLRELQQAARQGENPEHVEAVREAVWAAQAPVLAHGEAGHWLGDARQGPAVTSPDVVRAAVAVIEAAGSRTRPDAREVLHLSGWAARLTTEQRAEILHAYPVTVDDAARQ
jgi:hypothetical protein